MSKKTGEKSEHRKKLTDIYVALSRIICPEFVKHDLTDGEVTGFFVESLAMQLVKTIPQPDYSIEELNSILERISRVLGSAIKEGKRLRKNKENKNE